MHTVTAARSAAQLLTTAERDDALGWLYSEHSGADQITPNTTDEQLVAFAEELRDFIIENTGGLYPHSVTAPSLMALVWASDVFRSMLQPATEPTL